MSRCRSSIGNRPFKCLGKILAERNIRLPEICLPEPPGHPLTPREVDVLQLVAQGLGNQEIADKLVIGEATVRSHVSNILSKLHLASRTQAALYALREGYASLDD